MGFDRQLPEGGEYDRDGLLLLCGGAAAARQQIRNETTLFRVKQTRLWTFDPMNLESHLPCYKSGQERGDADRLVARAGIPRLPNLKHELDVF